MGVCVCVMEKRAILPQDEINLDCKLIYWNVAK